MHLFLVKLVTKESYIRCLLGWTGHEIIRIWFFIALGVLCAILNIF